jgi:hypothetical protein
LFSFLCYWKKVRVKSEILFYPHTEPDPLLTRLPLTRTNRRSRQHAAAALAPRPTCQAPPPSPIPQRACARHRHRHRQLPHALPSRPGFIRPTCSDWPAFPRHPATPRSVTACHLPTPVGPHDISLRTAQTRTRPRRPRPLPPCLGCHPPCPSLRAACQPTAVVAPACTGHLPRLGAQATFHRAPCALTAI